jgi:hypothetical protein
VHPDMTKTLTIVAVCQPVLGCTNLDLCTILQSDVNLKISCGFGLLAGVARKRAREMGVILLPECDVWQSCFTLMTS